MAMDAAPHSTLEVIQAEGGDRYDVVALAAGSSVDRLISQARQFGPGVVAVADETRERGSARRRHGC